jgi:UDP-N-acetylmuramoyl-L-alanyl-D-glutamate--2,6-diaminopimelate ligase
MGAAATRHADHVIITDDNPRTEDAARIRSEVLTGAKGAEEIGDRAQAIRRGVALLAQGDVLLVAGKGHEPGQTIGKTVHPFSDHEAVHAALAGEDYHG